MTDRYWQTAQQVLTPKQLRILELKDRYGFSLRLISWTTGTSIRTVRNQLDRAHQKLDLAMKEPA